MQRLHGHLWIEQGYCLYRGGNIVIAGNDGGGDHHNISVQVDENNALPFPVGYRSGRNLPKRLLLEFCCFAKTEVVTISPTRSLYLQLSREFCCL